jgi:tagatose-6-phosphate ketose/aldose isomerase
MAKEIFSQPKLWKETYEAVLTQKDGIASFLNEAYQIRNIQILLVGAGSSAFIGEILQYSFHKHTGLPVKAVPTTDLVTHPKNFFQPQLPILLVSFARSGDSPESLAAVELAESLNENVYHLVISCNPYGNLVKKVSGFKKSFTILLPAANDQALAMTSSFTCMTLAGLLIADITRIEANGAHVKQLIALGKNILKEHDVELDGVAKLDFNRIVFLGSGPLKGAARESHLKVTELTDGHIVCQYDSFLGFRHGPKAIIDESTLLIYLFSNDPYVAKYEADLVRSINATDDFAYSIGIGQNAELHSDLELDLHIYPGVSGGGISSGGNSASGVSGGGISSNGISDGELPDDFFAICGVLPAQILGYYKSMALGLTPDSPSKNGGIHRIVQGVTIYPY